MNELTTMEMLETIKVMRVNAIQKTTNAGYSLSLREKAMLDGELEMLTALVSYFEPILIRYK